MNADPIAGPYRWLEYAAFGTALERCRFSLLGGAAGAKRVLILGEGDGRFLARLAQANPSTLVDVVDSSAAMIALARGRVTPGRVQFFHQDALAPLPGAGYDVVVTNFFLDCLAEEDAQKLVAAVAERTTPGALWLVGDFALPAEGAARWHAQAWLR